MMNSKVRNSFFVWITSILFFSSIVLINYYSLVLSKNSVALFVFLGLVLIGVISFIIFFFSFIFHFRKKGWFNVGNRLIKFLKIILIVFTLPLIFLFAVIKPLNLIKLIKNGKAKTILSKQFFKNIFFGLLILISLFPLWGLAYFIAGYIPAYMAGLIATPIPMAGDSMYPTLPKGSSTADMKPYPNGIKISNINLFSHTISRGDIVVAENEKIRKLTKKLHGEASGIVKRVIALPRDKILIKDGLVFLNGKVLKEPYIARARSTYGGDFLRDCNEFKIPEGKLFLMGDNRKGSGDSRESGLIDYKDVQYVLPYKNQLGSLDKGWHDSKNDDKENARITLDVYKYLDLLNKQRTKAGLKPLRYEKRLENSAKLRGENILNFDDFSYEATKSGYTQFKAMNATGYSNIVWNEGIIQGSYEADELIKYLFEFPSWKTNLLEVKDYQDFGIIAVHGIANGCPTEVIVQHLAGYVPPNYKEKDIQGWGKLINDLNNVIPGWEKIKGYPNVNQDDLNKLLGLMYKRKNNAEAIYYRMKANQWLTSAEEQMINDNETIYEQETALAKKLNGK